MNKRFKHSTSRIYLYKMTTDNGGAPAVYRGRLSLAICKPRIRGKAEVGDWLIGVAGKGLRQGAPLIYIARVSEVLENGSYYADPRFAKRPDSIYRWNGSKLSIKPRAPFHDPMDAFRDIGSGPTHAGARVLLCDRYRYFGRGASDWYAAVAPTAHAVALSLGRGHRVNHSNAEYDAWMKVIKSAMRKPQPRTQPIGSKVASCGH